MTSTAIEFPKTSRVWIYQNKGPIAADILSLVKEAMAGFAIAWVSHNKQMTAFGGVLEDRFLVLIADESRVGAGGCSIDSSVHFFKGLEDRFGLDLFDRMCFSYKAADGIHTVNRDEFAALFAEGKINDNTIVYDTLVNTKGALDSSFEKPLGQSWHKRMV
ncbi:MAG: hypothetical protein KDC85_03475 [Saprospiraceae bacterium]|nr:hypothetical protein [Saprospiraceae bacterium]MCB9322505.1 hypothetical protein [Lewinellaceae bacterium]